MILLFVLGLNETLIKTNHCLLIVLIFVSTFLLFEYKLKTNHNITKNKKRFEEIKHEINTGDLIIFETTGKIDNLFYLIPVLFVNLNHIGICVKEKDKLYILECNPNVKKCLYSKRKKNGIVLLNLEQQIEAYDDVYLIKTNIHKQLKDSDVKQFLENHKDKKYMEGTLHCLSFVLLFLTELSLLQNIPINKLFFDYKFILNPKNYSYDFEHKIIKIQ